MEPSADVLIVAVTNVESRAVLRAFESTTGKSAQTVSIDDRVYRDLGMVHSSRVFLALSEMGTGGPGSSQQAVQKGIAALRPHAVIMVGIAFGVNEQKQTLGDILVSRQLMLYESQRVGAGEIVPRGDRPHASTRLVNYLQSAELEWNAAKVRFGLVLTGEKLLDNIDYRGQLLRLEGESIGGEMEGAGLYVACQDAKVDWILVKAICDWADGNKAQDKPTRQEQAAQNAVSFVVHALKHAPLNRPSLPAPDKAQSGGALVPPLSFPSVRSSLPHQPYFFGRNRELAVIAEAISQEARTWGVLIDGPGGIGKTALAVRAGHLASPTQFPLKIFLSAQLRELTPAGEEPLQDFMLSNYQDLLKELARELGEEDLVRMNPNERAAAVRRALSEHRALLVIDNVETLSEPERVRLAQFLDRLPDPCKAIVTSRRRVDAGAPVIRLDRLAQGEALDLLEQLARDNRPLKKASDADRLAFCEITHGNPLLMKWGVGQLGRIGSRCRTLADACAFLQAAPNNNDPLEYIFGDLVDSFTENETAVLAALSHFKQPAKLEWVAALTRVAESDVRAALEDLEDRALLIGDFEAKTYFLPPLAATFLRRRRPEVIAEAANRLADRAYALALESGYENHERFLELAAEWPTLAAALPIFLQSDNHRLQNVCEALDTFLHFSGQWDASQALSQPAEEKAVAAGDLKNAGWRAYQTGWIHYLRGQGGAALACARHCEKHWQEAGAGVREKATAIRLRGLSHELEKDYPAAQAAYQESLDLWRTIAAESERVATGLNSLAEVERLQGNLADAERDYREALRVAKIIADPELLAMTIGNLAQLALARKDWVEAETLAREALPLSEAVGRLELVGLDCNSVAKALAQQGKPAEGLPHAHRAVEIFTKLRQRDHLEKARAVLTECGG